MNKRGEGALKFIIWGFVACFVIGLLVYFIWGNPFEGTGDGFGSILDKGKQANGFDEVFNERAGLLNYVFGKIPEFLISWTSEGSAAIIIIGIWVLFVLAFGDILTAFGTFSEKVAWVAAVLLAIIAANINLITWISVVLLSITSFLGVLSVAGALGLAFVLFISFHLAGGKLRDWAKKRMLVDQALKADVGAMKAGQSIKHLAEVEKYFKEAGADSSKKTS